MNRRRLGLVGWLKTIKGAMIIPLNIYLFFSAFVSEFFHFVGHSPRVDFGARHPIDELLSILSTGLFVYTLLVIQKVTQHAF